VIILRLASLAQDTALRLASTSALRASADKSLAQGTARHCLATALFVAIAGGTSVFACPVCFGAEETPLIDGAKLGVAVMLAITFVVQGAFLGFFLYLRRRAKRMAEIDLDNEWSELQGASRT
jgi:hypothetical protein